MMQKEKKLHKKFHSVDKHTCESILNLFQNNFSIYYVYIRKKLTEKYGTRDPKLPRTHP